LDGQGDLAGARKMQDEALRNFTEVADKRGMASTLSNLGRLLIEQGDLAGAKSFYERDLQICQETGHRRGRGYALEGLGEIALQRGDMAEARRNMQEALAIRSEMGDEFNAAVTRVNLAYAAMEEGRPAEAEAPLRQAIEVFHKAKATDDEAVVSALLARALAAEGKASEAGAAVARGKALLVPGSGLPIRFEIALAEESIAAGPGRSAVDDRRKQLTAALREAVAHGYVGYVYQIRLALGELEVRSGNAAEGRRAMAALSNEAIAKGFGLIARKAREAMQAPG
jgi:tetratricopeptide (TPR) repeat protein